MSSGFQRLNVGSQEYFGVARGVYVATAGNDFYNEGSNIVGSYEGDFQATAEFENGGGNISGEVIIVTSNDYLVNTATRTIDLFKNTIFTWNDLEFTSDGQATGDVTVSFPGLVLIENEGKVGNRFSATSNSEGNPQWIAGTHGGSIRSEGDTQVGFVGYHAGNTEQ